MYIFSVSVSVSVAVADFAKSLIYSVCWPKSCTVLNLNIFIDIYCTKHRIMVSKSIFGDGLNGGCDYTNTCEHIY